MNRQQRIQRKPSRRVREYETAADLERLEKAKTARQRAMKASREAEAFLDWAVWGGRP